jgi:UDP-3-O-[3-hydroxymyristoyl] glucosamine N-acyltransferase
MIDGPAPAGMGAPSEITFAGDAKYLALAEQSDVGAILVGPGIASSKPTIQVTSPRAAFGRILAMCQRPLPLEGGIHRTAIVCPDASVDPTASIGAYAVIETGAKIGPRARVYPFCFVGERCHVGAETILYPHVVLYQDVTLGDRVIVHSGSILGADGFGYAWDGRQHLKVPQVGGVSVADDCEIGALTTVDRATAGMTVVGKGTKLDNQVMVAHNTSIGEHTVIASQSGIGGSSDIGKRVTFGGQVGIGDHVRVADDVTMAARAAAPNDVLEPGLYKGYPARPFTREQRILAITERLPELAKQIKDLERRIAELEGE